MSCLPVPSSADDGRQGLTQLRGLGRVELDHQPSTALERHAHHDAAPLLRDLERAVTGPRLVRSFFLAPRVPRLPVARGPSYFTPAPAPVRMPVRPPIGRTSSPT